MHRTMREDGFGSHCIAPTYISSPIKLLKVIWPSPAPNGDGQSWCTIPYFRGQMLRSSINYLYNIVVAVLKLKKIKQDFCELKPLDVDPLGIPMRYINYFLFISGAISEIFTAQITYNKIDERTCFNVRVILINIFSMNSAVLFMFQWCNVFVL